jgi:hypothetical protein
MRFVCLCGWSSPSLLLFLNHHLSCNQTSARFTNEYVRWLLHEVPEHEAHGQD